MIRIFISLGFSLYCLDSSRSVVEAASDASTSMECLADGSCTATVDACTFYFAESTIPGAGWGVYAGTDIGENSTIDVHDILIPYVNDERQTQFQSTLYGIQHRDALISAYTTDLSVLADSFLQDENVLVQSLAPGLGLLAKAHRGWSNMDSDACRRHDAGSRVHASAGASTSHRDCTFHATAHIPVGHELFHGHGQGRMTRQVNTKPTSSRTRSLDWLKHHGMCLDHIQAAAPSSDTATAVPLHQQRAIARRFLPKDTIVAPAPVFHLNRSQVEILMVDTYGEPDTTLLWKGYQLLLNYCFGHPSSSLLFFPYGPGVNLINHADHQSDSIHPNVAVRWSSRMTHPEWLRYNVSRLLEVDALNEKGGLHMEYYALRDIQPGEELWLDYGTAWQTAWEDHVENWNHYASMEQVDPSFTSHWKEYKSAWEYSQECDALVQQGQHECLLHTPAWINVRCSMAPVDTLPLEDETPWRTWRASHVTVTTHRSMQSTVECRIMNANADGTYGIQLLDEGNGAWIKNVPRTAILLLDQPYSSPQFDRHAFRHEIQLPNDMVPPAWRNLDPKTDPSCGLFVAESSIPNSGLGMFTARTISNGERIFSGEVVVQAEDYNTHARIRQYVTKSQASTFWLMENYFWTSKVSMGNFDGVHVESLIPGLGMLANSHVGMISANLKAPKRYSRLQKYRDPGTGASSSYNDVHYTAAFAIEAGAELYVDYGDAWFSGRESAIGVIPLRDDFAEADVLLADLSRILVAVRYNRRALTNELLRIVSTISSVRPRLAMLIPKDETGLESSLSGGSARLTVPNRVRSTSWLQKNGRCIDNIKPGASTIRQAGNGAFATRRIKKGDVIAPMPLAHALRHHMEVYDGEDENDPDGTFWLVGQQLLLNYCYGHPSSSLLFFPYSPVVNYVNHQSGSSGKVNADLQWSTLANHQKDWLHRTPDDLAMEDHAGLIMEMVATRDIEAGEEVFLSYGEAWDAAWKSFAGTWKPTDSDLKYSSTGELNKRLDWIKTTDEKETSPYPYSNDIITVCFVSSFDWSVPGSQDTHNTRTVKWMGNYRLFHSSDFAYECRIDERHHGSTVRDQVFNRLNSVNPVEMLYTVTVESDNFIYTVVDVPRKAIQFFDAQYKAEYMMRTSFRHEIHLPDSLVPPAWRDLVPK